MVYGFGPFDAAYAKGDSVKLAAINGNIVYENEDAGFVVPAASVVSAH